VISFIVPTYTPGSTANAPGGSLCLNCCIFDTPVVFVYLAVVFVQHSTERYRFMAYDGDTPTDTTDEKPEDGTDEHIIHEALEVFEVCEDVWGDNFNRYEEDVKFGRKGEQWDKQDLEQRKADGRPSMTINRMPAFIRQVVNDARQNKPQIKVHPQDSSADPKTAEVLNGIIRNIESTSKADLAYDTAIDCAASGGFGYIRVDVDYADDDTFDMDICIDRIINPLTVYPDPHSTSADSSDWDDCFITEIVPEEEFEERYPKADKSGWSAGEEQDKRRLWFKDDGIRVAEYWKRRDENYDIHLLNNGEVIDDETYKANEEALAAMGVTIEETRKTTRKKVTQYIMTANEILETNEWEGKFIPIIPVYGEEVYIDGERNFYSLIHFSKDAQIMYNYWRTTSTELVAMAPKAPWIGPVGAFNTDMSNWQNANTETLPFLEYDGDIPPQRQPFAGPPAGALQEALNATDDMKSVMGLHDAAMGAQSNEISGVAIGKRVREGDTSTFHFSDNMSRAIRHTGNIILDLIPRIYTTARIVRILGEDGTPQTVAVNQPIENPEQAIDGHFDQQEQMEAIENIYDLKVGKYDVTVKAGPSYTTQREESRESMMALVSAFPQAAAVTGDLIVESMDWPNADAFAKRLKSLLPPGTIDEEQDPQAAALAQQVQEMDAVIQQLMAGKEAKMADLQVQREKLQIDADNAETNRLKAETDRMKASAEVELKQSQLELEAAKSLQPAAKDDSAIVLKEMDLNHDQAKTEQDNAIEQEKLELERQKLALEAEKIALERYKAEVDACARMSEAAKPAPEADQSIAPLGEKPDSQPIQVFNVQAASKNIDIKRGADGEITGAEVREE